MGSYWDVDPDARSSPRSVPLVLPDVQADLATDTGVFAASGVDRGTQVLLRQAPAPEPHTGVLDLGCGYGPIALAMASRQPRAGVWAVDVNQRALALTRTNTRGLSNVVVAAPADIPATLCFDGLYSNPPIKIGKDSLRQLLVTWLDRLVPGSYAWLVVKQAMGADSLHRWLGDTGLPTMRAASKQGYRVLRVTAPGQRPASLHPDDMARIEKDTGASWTVLGRLAGGHSDCVLMLQHGSAHAVLKIKDGDWWPAQLDRLIPVVQELRQLGYPAPEVYAAGPLPHGQRAYLLTAWSSGDQPTTQLSRAQLDVVLAAAELHRHVHPPADRDWSAMITLFLNGGISECSFHPALTSYVRQAMSLIPKPVPTLPNGDFVHGDFWSANMLFDNDRLTAVLDSEAFGTGTVAVDLLSLLPELSVDESRAVVDLATQLTSPDIVAACLVHRILAILDWPTHHPQVLDRATKQAQHLLALVP